MLNQHFKDNSDLLVHFHKLIVDITDHSRKLDKLIAHSLFSQSDVHTAANNLDVCVSVINPFTCTINLRINDDHARRFYFTALFYFD